MGFYSASFWSCKKFKEAYNPPNCKTMQFYEENIHIKTKAIIKKI